MTDKDIQKSKNVVFLEDKDKYEKDQLLGLPRDIADKYIKEGVAEPSEKQADNIITEKRHLSDIEKGKIDKFLKNPFLIEEIWKELDKKHKLDHREKLTLFLVAITGLFDNPKDRKSVALLGDSAVGKDNLIDTVLELFPEKYAVKFTSVTKAGLEGLRDIETGEQKRIIVLSELNTNTENGANKDVIETIKQLSEGGSNRLMKDVATGFKDTISQKVEQSSIMWSSTELKKNYEMETRFICVSIRGYPAKTKIVNDDTLRNCGDIGRILENNKQKDKNFIKEVLEHLMARNKDRDIQFIMPYWEKISPLIDDTSPRSQRDIKRLICISNALTWLYQDQRDYIDIPDTKIRLIVSEPIDFFNAYSVSEESFTLSYSGIDKRLAGVLKIMKDLEFHDGFNVGVLKKDIQDKISVSRPTINSYIKILKDEDYIEYDHENGTIKEPRYFKCKRSVKAVLNTLHLFSDLIDDLSCDCKDLYSPLQSFNGVFYTHLEHKTLTVIDIEDIKTSSVKFSEICVYKKEKGLKTSKIIKSSVSGGILHSDLYTQQKAATKREKIERVIVIYKKLEDNDKKVKFQEIKKYLEKDGFFAEDINKILTNMLKEGIFSRPTPDMLQRL